MPPTTLRSPTLKLGGGAPAPRAKEQHGPAIGRRQFPQLLPQTFVIGVALGPSPPGQAVDLLLGRGARFQAILGLELQIELHGLLEALAGRVAAPPGPAKPADLEGGDDDCECDQEP